MTRKRLRSPVLDLSQIPGGLKPRKQSKYNAVRTQNADGTWSDSRKEAIWDAVILTAAAQAGCRVLRKEGFDLVVEGVKICRYISDWTIYLPEEQGRLVCDCKGFKTSTYKIKKKLFEAIHKEQIHENLIEILNSLK